MIIINAFLRFTSVTYQRVRVYFSSDRQASIETSEATGLFSAGSSESRASLTAGDFADFYHTEDAIWVCIFHAAVYYTVAVVAFSFLVEKWPIIDSLYFATTIFTTIGFGDLHPTSNSGQCLTIVLALYGVVILGIFIGILGEVIVDSHNKAMQKQSEILHVEVTGALSREGIPEVVEDLIEEVEQGKPLISEIFSIIMLEAPLVSVVVVLALIIGHVEGWSLLGSLYWIVVAASTIGFGDYTPTIPTIRLACCFFLPLAVAVLGELLARIASVYMKRANKKARKIFLSRSLTLSDLKTMDVDNNGQVDRAEFITYMLVALQKVTKEELDELSILFQRLDKTHEGFLSKRDLVQIKGSIRTSIRRMNAAPLNDYE